MTLTQWFIFILVVQIIHFAGTWKLYIQAGRKAWEALIPIYNGVVLMKIINRPTWWILLLFIPIVNLLMFPVIWVETVRTFGKNKAIDTWLAILTLGFYIYYINYAGNTTYTKNRSRKPQSTLGEWVNSIVFAVIVATIVHTYGIQPYIIPTSSLEKTLLVGDYLFVSKFHYGARIPMTTVASPMVHDTLPILKTRSYLKTPQLPYLRLPGFEKVKRNEIVVFNWPTDTVRFFRDNSGIHVDKPIDKKSNYVKRCVAIPGDTLQIKDGYIYINGERTVLPDRAKPQYFHKVETKEKLSGAVIKRYEVTEGADYGDYYLLNLTDVNAEKMRNNPLVKSVTKQLDTSVKYDASIFPHNSQYRWNVDNYGPIYMPKAGQKITLNSKNIPLYKQIISEYEGHNLTVNGNDIFIDGKKASEYTFAQDYYWMMGDNRHNSEDSRYWGYVPYNHILGKPVLIWFSWDSKAQGGIMNKIRWNRLFTTVHGSGKPVSYLNYVLGAIILYFIISFIVKRRKERE